MLGDILIFHQLNGLAFKHSWLDTLAIFLAEYLPYVLAGVLFLFLLKNFRKHWKMVAGSVLAGFLGWLITQIIRFFWFHSRPFAVSSVNLLLTHSPTSSFPSAHTTAFFALSALLLFYNKKLGVIFLIASFLIGLARVFCGLHWPSDVLAGIVLGVLVAIFVHQIIDMIGRKV